MKYSVNHFARMERDNCEITLSQAFDICNALDISFTQLMMFSNCVEFFTDAKGVFVSLSELKKRYPHSSTCFHTDSAAHQIKAIEIKHALRK